MFGLTIEKNQLEFQYFLDKQDKNRKIWQKEKVKMQLGIAQNVTKQTITVITANEEMRKL